MKINIVLPVFNDWESLNYLIRDIKEKLDYSFIEITIINDCSSLKVNIKKVPGIKIKILSLNENVGSQKAIKVGLKYLYDKKISFDYCVVMDSDGEDKAEDIVNLINMSKNKSGEIIFGSRGKRQDGPIFYALYKIYLLTFFIFTGKNINCGNFSCFSKDKIGEIIMLKNSEIHHSASILRSILKYDKFLCNRGKRFKGKSKMSFKNLIIHGLNAMAIFFELIVFRFCKFFLLIIFILGISFFSLILSEVSNSKEILNFLIFYNIDKILISLISGLSLILLVINYFKMKIKKLKKKKIDIEVLTI